MAEHPDLEAEGLLEDLEEDERKGRLELLEELFGDGVPLEELRAAVADGRLGALPVERALVGEPRYTPGEVAERSGVPIEVLERQWRSIGIAIPDRDEMSMSSEDLDAAHRQRELLDAGLDPDQIAELGRTAAVAMSQFAAATRQVMAASFIRPGDTEREAADRVFEGTTPLLPLVGPTLEYIYRLHLREQLRHAVLAAGDRAAGAEIVTIAFADLVGYTELGEALPPEELGRVTGALDEHARDAATGPVRLVKLLGDAAMLTSTDTGAVIAATFELLDSMADEGEGTPLIRAGIARGPALSRGGDYYGSSVNVASRVTDVARPGSVLVTREVRDEVEDRFSFSSAGRKHLKGIKGSVDLYRCRPLEGGRDGGSDEGESSSSSSSRRRKRRG
jgi:adenylate cyclase